MVPTGNGYVVYKPADQVAGLCNSVSVNTASTAVVSLPYTSGSINAPVTVSNVASLPSSNSGANIVTSMPQPLQPRIFVTSPTTFPVANHSQVRPKGPGVPVNVGQNSQDQIRAYLRTKIDKNSGMDKSLNISRMANISIDPIVLNKSSEIKGTTHSLAAHVNATSAVSSDDKKVFSPTIPAVIVTTIINTVNRTTTNSSNIAGSGMSYVSLLGSASMASSVSSVPRNTIITKTAGDKKAVYYRKMILPTLTSGSATSVVQTLKTEASSEGTAVKIPIVQRNLNIKSVVLPVSSPTSTLQMVPVSSPGVPGQNKYVISQTFSKPIVMFSPGSVASSTGKYILPAPSSSAVPKTVNVVSPSTSKPPQTLVRPSISVVSQTSAVQNSGLSQNIVLVQSGVTQNIAIPKNPMLVSIDDMPKKQ